MTTHLLPHSLHRLPTDPGCWEPRTCDQGGVCPVSPFGALALISVPTSLKPHPGGGGHTPTTPLLPKPRAAPSQEAPVSQQELPEGLQGLRHPPGQPRCRSRPVQAWHGTQLSGTHSAHVQLAGPSQSTAETHPGSTGSSQGVRAWLRAHGSTEGSRQSRAESQARPDSGRSQRTARAPAALPLWLWGCGFGAGARGTCCPPTPARNLHPHSHEHEEPQVSKTNGSNPETSPKVLEEVWAPRGVDGQQPGTGISRRPSSHVQADCGGQEG